MLYEIFFDPLCGKWKVKVSVMRFAYTKMQAVCGPSIADRAGEPRTFDTYGDAEEYCNMVGLPAAYDFVDRRQSAKHTLSLVSQAA